MLKMYMLFFSLGISITLYSQNWCDDGAVWHYGYANVGGAGYVRIDYQKDTLVGGKTCQLLKKRLYYTDGSSGITIEQFIGNAFTYFQDDVVYAWDNFENDFDTLYYFGAKPGDTWSVSSLPNPQSNTMVLAEALNRGNISINGVVYRWVYVEYQFIGSSAGSVFISDTVYSQYGQTGLYMFPADYYYSITDAHEGGAFRCYSDSNTSLFNINPALPCDYTTSTNEISSQQTRVYPNPFKEILRVEPLKKFSYPCNVKILNLNGNVVYQQRILKVTEEGFSFDLRLLPSGMYALTLSDNIQTEVLRIIKQ